MVPVAVPEIVALKSTPVNGAVPVKVSCQFEELVDTFRSTDKVGILGFNWQFEVLMVLQSEEQDRFPD